MVSFRGPFLESKRKSPFSIRGFWAGADGRMRGGRCFVLFFCFVSPGQGGNSSCTARTPECPPPPPPLCGGRGGPATSFRLSGLHQAETRSPQPRGGVHCAPGTAASSGDPPEPLLSPTPVFPARSPPPPPPPGWWSEETGSPPLTGLTGWLRLGRGNCDLRPRPWPWRPRCVPAVQRWSLGVFLFFVFLLILLPFSKTGY